jgi:G3E family GTPase
MGLVALPVGAATGEELGEAAEKAARLFSHEENELASGDGLRPGNTLHRLRLEAAGEKRFAVEIERPGPYAFYTQHLPEEFDLRLEGSAGALAPEAFHVFNPEHEHDQSVTSVGLHLDGDLDPQRLNRWLSTLLRERGTDIFRMKGTLSMRGDDRRFIFQGVHMLFDGRPDRPWSSREERTNQLVFIGRHLNRNELAEGLAACLV